MSDDSSELDELLELDVTSSAEDSPLRGCASAIEARSGRFSRSFASHCALIFGRPRRVMRHTLSNRDDPTTFCVTATV